MLTTPSCPAAASPTFRPTRRVGLRAGLGRRRRHLSLDHLPGLRRHADPGTAPAGDDPLGRVVPPHSTGLIRDKDRGNDYGDWLSIGADTPKDVIGTAFFAYSTGLLARSYAALGKSEEAAKYEQLFQDIKAAFNKRYVAADGRIQGNTQCCYVMALRFDLLPEELRPKAAQYLEDDIKAKGWHLSTGFVGVSHLLPVLTQAGKTDTAYRLLMQDTFPSWLFSVKHGATTIWERWDGWTPEHGFQDPGMNSFNHYSLGSCGQWLFDTVAGIGLDPDHLRMARRLPEHPHPSAARRRPDLGPGEPPFHPRTDRRRMDAQGRTRSRST